MSLDYGQIAVLLLPIPGDGEGTGVYFWGLEAFGKRCVGPRNTDPSL